MRRRPCTGAGWWRRSGCDCSVWTRSRRNGWPGPSRAFAAGPGRRAGQHAARDWLGWLSEPVSRPPRSSRWPASAPRSASSSLGTRWPKCSIHRLILPGGTHEKTANCRSAGNTGLSILSGDAQPNGLTPRQRCQLKPTSLLESRGGSE